jgi:polysaccharide biosynthesis PFTS motif protein
MMTLIYSLTRDQIYVLNEKRSIYELMIFLKSKPFNFNSPDIFIIENRRILIKNYKNSRAVVVFDIPVLLFIQYLEARQRRRIVLQLFVEIKRENSFIQFKQDVFDKLVYQNCLLKGLGVNLVTTQSHLNKLPAIFKIKRGSQVKTSMLWYSVNSIPIQSRVSEKFNYPRSWIENLSNIDMNYVWTEPDPLDILSLTGAKFKVVGSIMFYKPSHTTQAQLSDFKILILDVTPLSNLPKDSIYNYEYAIEFLKDIIAAGEYLRGKSLQVELVLKPKRSYSTKHHFLYTNYIESLEKNKIIRCLPFSSDIYRAVSKSKIVISPPYSSGALIAKEMNVKACYYVPSVSASKFELPVVMHGTPVLKGLNELMKFVTP